MNPIQIVNLLAVESADQFLYHYTKTATALDHILPSRTLRMSPFSVVNDPWEAKHWFVEALAGAGPKDDAAGMFMLDGANRLKAQSKLLCFTRDAPEAALTDGDINWGTVWHRGFCRPRMCSHYATREKPGDGVCLVFDKAALVAAVESALPASASFKCGDVHYENRVSNPGLIINYRDIKLRGPEIALADHAERHYRSLFFSKSTDWQTEREFRFFASGITTEYFAFSFQNALLAVIGGPDFPDDERGRMIDLCKSQFGFEPSQLFWQNGYPQPFPQMLPPGYGTYHQRT